MSNDDDFEMEDDVDVQMEDVDTPMEDDDTPDDSMIEDDGPEEPAPTPAPAPKAAKKKAAKKPAKKKAAKKKAAKKKKSAKDPDQPEPVKIGEIPDKDMEVLEGLYKGHKLFVIHVGGKRRLSFGFGKAALVVECIEDIKKFVEKHEARSGGMEDV